MLVELFHGIGFSGWNISLLKWNVNRIYEDSLDVLDILIDWISRILTIFMKNFRWVSVMNRICAYGLINSGEEEWILRSEKIKRDTAAVVVWIYACVD